jgi:hypothetical protein
MRDASPDVILPVAERRDKGCPRARAAPSWAIEIREDGSGGIGCRSCGGAASFFVV